MSRLSLILVALVSWSTILSTLLPTVTGLRIYKMRDTLMNILNPDDTGEERLYMEFCQQSSNTGNCMLAIDDDVIHEWTQCSSSEPEDYGYWKAQLETPAYVTRVVINTVEMPDSALQNGLNDFSVSASGVTCYRHISSEKFESKSFPCDALADEIAIQSYRNGAVLSLCEVQVYGKLVTFQGLETGEMELDFQSCDQSTVLGDNECNYALDRNFLQYPGKDGKVCAQTEVEEHKSWWVVYFARPALVKHVKVYNRIDCCQEEQSKFHVIVNEAVCAKHHDKAPFVTKIFICERFGSSVKIESQLEKSKISVCQVQVFGHTMVVLRDSNINYLGCFKDNADNLDFELLVSSTWMSPKKCRKMCKRLNKVYFGLQNGQVCMCGNKYGRHGKADDPSQCDMPCKDDGNVYCGGLGMNSVYEIAM